MQHVAFATSPEGAKELLERLNAHGVENSGVIETLPGLMGIYFFDPNGIRLEFAWRPVDSPSDIHVIDSVPQAAEDALEELRSLSDDPAWLEEATRYWKQPART